MIDENQRQLLEANHREIVKAEDNLIDCLYATRKALVQWEEAMKDPKDKQTIDFIKQWHDQEVMKKVLRLRAEYHARPRKLRLSSIPFSPLPKK